MRVLVTGSRGLIGTVLADHLAAEGHDVVSFDLVDGQDVRDDVAVGRAVRGCDAIVHLAAIADPSAPTDAVRRTNVEGTRNVLRAAREAPVGRVVHVSSVNALGVFRGEGEPDYLPIDDDHPCRPRSAYGRSKLEGEALCRGLTAHTGTPTVCLRPPAVWAPETYERILQAREEDPSFEWSPFWEYGAFLDVRDSAEAAVRALSCRDPGHVTLLLCAPDISTAGGTSQELAARLLPDVPWRGGDAYERDPQRALLDTSRATRVLGWTPVHTWRAWLDERARGVAGG